MVKTKSLKKELAKKPSFVNPADVVDKWKITEGQIAADLGCGSGFFVIPLAKKVGMDGKVYAVDIRAAPLESVTSKAFLERLNNVVTVRGDLEKKTMLKNQIPDNECDVVLLANVLFGSKDKAGMLKEAKRILAKDGTLIVIDWKKKVKAAFSTIGPDIKLRISEVDMKKLVRKIRMVAKDKFEAGKFHYGIIFKSK